MSNSRNIKSIDPVNLKKGDLIKIYSGLADIEREQHFIVIEPSIREVKQTYHRINEQKCFYEREALVLRNNQYGYKGGSPYVIKIGAGVLKCFNNGNMQGFGKDTVVKITIESLEC